MTLLLLFISHRNSSFPSPQPTSLHASPPSRTTSIHSSPAHSGTGITPAPTHQPAVLPYTPIRDRPPSERLGSRSRTNNGIPTSGWGSVTATSSYPLGQASAPGPSIRSSTTARSSSNRSQPRAVSTRMVRRGPPPTTITMDIVILPRTVRQNTSAAVYSTLSIFYRLVKTRQAKSRQHMPILYQYPPVSGLHVKRRSLLSIVAS